MPPPKGTPRAKLNVAPRLPPLPKLRVKQPNKVAQNPCNGIMASVLGCWASAGQAAEACRGLEQQLRACMDAPRPPQKAKNNINYHLGRMYPSLAGPRKKK